MLLSGWRHDVHARTRLLVRATEIAEADRAVLFWVDDYRDRQPRVDRVVDIASDPPRRGVSTDLLERAMGHGFPGLLDAPDRNRAAGVLLFPEAPSSTALISIGGDGTRSWFLLVDCITPRGRLTIDQRNALMFVAGELSTAVQHPLHTRWSGASGSFESAREEAFAGWGVLGDLAEGTASEADRERVNVRFLVSRLVKTYLEEGLWMEAEGLAEQIRQIRQQIADAGTGLAESTTLDAVLSALELGRADQLARATQKLGDYYQEDEQLHAAREFLLSAFELAVHVSDAAVAMETSWGIGLASRRAADWDGAFRWYTLASDLAREFGNWHTYGRVLDGLGNAYRDRGNLPRSREVLAEALNVSAKTSDPEMRASVLHTLMTVELLSAQHGTAIVYGWEAVQCQADPQRRLLALADLGAAFLEAGQYESAEESLSVVMAEATDRDVRIIALSSLCLLSATLGKRAQYDAHCQQMETERWQSASAIIRGQVMFERGLALAWLGERERAEEWLALAALFGESHQVAKMVLDVEAALETLRVGGTPGTDRRHRPTPETAATVSRDRRVLEVRREVSQLRVAAVVGA